MLQFPVHIIIQLSNDTYYLKNNEDIYNNNNYHNNVKIYSEGGVIALGSNMTLAVIVPNIIIYLTIIY